MAACAPQLLEMGGTAEAGRRATEDSSKKVLAFLDEHLT
jgi:hypothetical protein